MIERSWEVVEGGGVYGSARILPRKFDTKLNKSIRFHGWEQSYNETGAPKLHI